MTLHAPRQRVRAFVRVVAARVGDRGGRGGRRCVDRALKLAVLTRSSEVRRGGKRAAERQASALKEMVHAVSSCVLLPMVGRDVKQTTIKPFRAEAPTEREAACHSVVAPKTVRAQSSAGREPNRRTRTSARQFRGEWEGWYGAAFELLCLPRCQTRAYNSEHTTRGKWRACPPSSASPSPTSPPLVAPPGASSGFFFGGENVCTQTWSLCVLCGAARRR